MLPASSGARRAIAAASALIVLAISPGAASAATSEGQWHTVPGPQVPSGDSANLTALAMADPDQGWAAGFVLPNNPAEGGFEPLLASWNGRRWSVVRVDTGSASGRLDGLAAASPDDVWAVGTAFSGRGVARPLILHWNGRRWTRTPAPSPHGVQAVSLLGVAARSASDAWAVGQQETSTAMVSPVIEHWNGRAWHLVRVPDLAPFRQAGLSSVTIAADGQAWAVGVPFDNSQRPLVLRWTGRAWTLALTPASSGDVMADGVTALGDSDVWTVGTISSGSGGAFHAYAAHWNGRRWAVARVPAPGPADNAAGFQSVAAIGGGRLAAVGTDLGPVTGAALYGWWNGRAWSVRVGPMSRADADLSAVAFDGRRTIWTVGTSSPSPQTFVPLVQVRKL
jgi:hypothetical protein